MTPPDIKANGSDGVLTDEATAPATPQQVEQAARPNANAKPDRPEPEWAALPGANTKRWTARRKAAVVIAVSNGRFARQEVCRRYRLSEEELLGWEQAFTSHGIPGLRATQQYGRLAETTISVRGARQLLTRIR